MTSFQLIICIVPFILLLGTTIFTSITQRIWKNKKYIICFSVGIVYGVAGLSILNFNFKSGAFVLVFVPLIYFLSCYLTDKIFLKIKPSHIERDFPIFTLFTDWGDEYWSTKYGGPPISEDKVVSTVVVLLSIFAPLILIVILNSTD